MLSFVLSEIRTNQIMGIKERHERDREAVRKAILDAARDLFVAEGYQNVSIRKIAERIEYSPAAIYGYFPSKDDIFFELAEQGFRLLSEFKSLDALASLAPLDRVRAIFWHLYEFSRDHPQYFTLMFIERSVPRITREYERFAVARDMKSRIAGHIQACIDAKIFPAAVKPMVAFRVLTMVLIGVAVMRLSDRLGPFENPDDLARDMIEIAIAGLQSGIALRSTGIPCPEDDVRLTPEVSAPATRSVR